MSQEKNYITLEDRKYLEINGVSSILTFDDEYVKLDTAQGVLSIEGRGMTVEDLSSQTGIIKIRGEIGLISFAEKKEKRGLFGLLR